MSAVRRAIQVIDLLARKGALGVRAVAQQLDLPVGSVHRLLQDLAQENVVARNSEGAWQLDYRLLQISDLHMDNLRLPRLARSFCEDIAEKTRETVNLNVLSEFSCVCVDKVRGNQGMQLDRPIGSRSPLHCGGSAKAMLAFMSEAEQDRVIKNGLTGFTDNTLTDAKALKDELARTRERGYSIDDQEMVLGVFCVGVPIVDRLGHPIAAISISGPSHKQAGAEVAPLVEMLNKACGHVSERLGYTGPWPLPSAQSQTRQPAKQGA